MQYGAMKSPVCTATYPGHDQSARLTLRPPQDGDGVQHGADEDALLGTPEVVAADLLEAFAAADATAEGAEPSEWTIASFGTGADARADGESGQVGSSPGQLSLGTVRLSELETDGDDASEVGSELSFMHPVPPRGGGKGSTPLKSLHATPGCDLAGAASEEAQHDSGDFTFSVAPGGVGHGLASVSPVWGPLLRSARAAPATGVAATSNPAAGSTAIASASQVATADVKLGKAPAKAPQPATSEQLLARLAALAVPPASAAVRKLRASAETLDAETAFLIHVAMAQILLKKEVPWLVGTPGLCLLID